MRFGIIADDWRSLSSSERRV